MARNIAALVFVAAVMVDGQNNFDNSNDVTTTRTGVELPTVHVGATIVTH